MCACESLALSLRIELAAAIRPRRSDEIPFGIRFYFAYNVAISRINCAIVEERRFSAA